MIQRRKTKKIKIGNTFIGGNSKVSVQSMLNKKTFDYQGNINQAKELEKNGCELIRIAILNKESINLINKLKENISIPVISDIHFNYKFGIESIYAGVDAVRINPGNMDKNGMSQIVKECKIKNIPIRIGINGGSLSQNLLYEYGYTSDAIVKSAMNTVKLFEQWDFDQIVISVKTSRLDLTVDSYKKISSLCDYPLHVGVSEAGTEINGLIKSSIGIGSLLLNGIGDTIRVSLSTDPLKEVEYGIKILKSLNLRDKGVEVVSCPTCGRTSINVEYFANKIENELKCLNKNIKIAVMGCPVNGPGEARDADLGVTGVDGMCLIFKNGKIIKKVKEDQLISELMVLINT